MTKKLKVQTNGTQNPTPITEFQYSYNYQGQLSKAQRIDTQTPGYSATVSYGYDPLRQRVFYNTPAQSQVGMKWVYWDVSGHEIGEGVTRPGLPDIDYAVRYIYSGNQKIAMIRPDETGAEQTYYFINNAQGTPALIVDEAGTILTRQKMDEFGNLECDVFGSKNEVDYTGKKKDRVTGLIYFNQRYYDSEIGRFISQDPKAQGLNLYAYCGNDPLGNVDPDGEFFAELFTAFCPGLGTLLGAALDGGLLSAAINGGVQLATTGKIDGQQMLNSFASGALSGGLANGIGQLGTSLGLGNDLVFKTVAHGLSGGIQSAASGGNFWAGVAGGAAGNIGGSFMGDDFVGRVSVGALSGGAAELAAGGSFWGGFQAGAYNAMYNHFLDDAVGALGNFAKNFGVGVEGQYGVISGSYGTDGTSVGVGVPAYGAGAYATFVPGGNFSGSKGFSLGVGPVNFKGFVTKQGKIGGGIGVGLYFNPFRYRLTGGFSWDTAYAR